MKRVVLVTAHWGAPDEELGAVIRLMAGALAARANLEVVSLQKGSCKSASARAKASTTRRDSVFVVHELAATRAEAHHAGLLRAALASGGSSRLPEIAGPRLAELYGGRTTGLEGLLGVLRPEVVLLAGPETWWVPGLLADTASDARVVSVPLVGADAIGDTAPLLPLVSEVEAVGVLSRAEKLSVEGRIEVARDPSRPPTEVVELEIAFGLNRPAAQQLMVGMSQFGRFVVVMTAFPDGSPPASRSPGGDYVRQLLGPIAVAEVGRGRWRISDRSREREVPVGPSRANLLKLLSHAEVCLDLRPQGIVGRETLESLALGTPVVVPEGTVAAEHAERSGGGLWYRDYRELFEAAKAVVEDPSLRQSLSERGRAWATERHGDQARFSDQVARLVLG